MRCLNYGHDKLHLRDKLLSIAKMTEKTTVFKVIPHIDSLTKAIELYTPALNSHFNSCFTETFSTKAIKMLRWPAG